ncbi:MAG: RsmB/NOP family class I SAM-dependent RNA methyltransferase [Rubellimicrobium sp.]|nr:RsmB/NOP family class I SAM-dependent RNA methyltransferase [Rubellimicrobium sp.]
MTPGARVQAAIDCLDRILAGAPAEQVLTRWARDSRYAGARDRAAVRDHVYGALRRLRSAGVAGGGTGARAVMIGALGDEGADLPALFTGIGHAPAPLAPHEGHGSLADAPAAVRADLPDWIFARLAADHGPDLAARIGASLRERAPVWLRANVARTTRADAMAALAAEGIGARPHDRVATALRVTENAAKIQTSAAYASGLVEVQDAASQEAVLRLPLGPGLRVLDYCAGGGGKALAIAALTGGPVHVHDADPRRMRDLPARAARAGADIRLLPDPAGRLFDLVVVDAPCSGSGTWRRGPDAKWRLTPGRLDDLVALQSRIAAEAAALVAPGGALAWMTCSVFDAENAGRARAIAAQTGWPMLDEMARLPDDRGDGFYLALFSRP